MVVIIALALLISTIISHKIGYAKISRSRVAQQSFSPLSHECFVWKYYLLHIHGAESPLRS